jgi:hypothetical protein
VTHHATQFVTIAVDPLDAKIARLRAELAALRGETIAAPVVARGHWEKRCNGVSCSMVWVADAGFAVSTPPVASATVTATVTSACPTAAVATGPVRAFFAARPVVAWFQSRPRLFHR